MSFPEQLKKARLAAGYTQMQVATAMGITNSTYCGYETGKRQPDVAKIKQLAALLHTSGDVLLETGYRSAEEQSRDPQLEEAMSLLQSLRPAFRDYAIDQIKKLAALQDK